MFKKGCTLKSPSPGICSYLCSVAHSCLSFVGATVFRVGTEMGLGMEGMANEMEGSKDRNECL